MSALIAGALAALACQSPAVSPEAQMTHLRFLEGRWTGTAPDGSTFYEMYDFPTPARMRSRRFDAAFTIPGDGSSVAIEQGVIVSRWGAFSWRASEVCDGYAAFQPVEAPSNFSWRRVDADTTEVIQRWIDAEGRAQSYTVTLRRVR